MQKNLVNVNEAAEILISSKFNKYDDNQKAEYKAALKSAKQKIYKAVRRHQLDVFGSSKILLNTKQIESFIAGKITARSMYSPFGNITLDFDESIRFLESFHNPNSANTPLKYKSICQYAVSNRGRIIDLTYRRVLSQNKSAHGYLQTSLRVNGKKFDERVHVLVAFVWCPNGKLKCEVHHIDGDIDNNNAVNLIWMTKSEHIKAHELLKKAKETNDFSEYNKFIAKIQKDNEWNEEYRCVAFEKENATIFVWITKKAYNDYKNGIRTLDEIYYDEVKSERIVRK